MFNKTFAALIFASVFAVFLVTTPLLEGQVVPYKASGTNAQYNPDPASGEYFGSGQGTHLGRHTIYGKLAITGIVTNNPNAGPDEVFFEGTFAGFQVVTARNGDTLKSMVSGTVKLTVGDDNLVSGIWEPTFELMGSESGRFKNSTGTLVGVAINPPFDRTSPMWPFDWSIDGEFDLGKKKNK